ncbi:MAG: molybdenum cofactor guanylyltransferase MobA [Candidatus Puniceispirillales bacterium]
MITRDSILGVVLAGGQGRRMGGGVSKPLVPLGQRVLMDHVLDRATPQCHRMIINANGDSRGYDRFGLPIVPDNLTGFPGPLAGVLAALDWASQHAPQCHHVMSFAGDAPFLPRDLVARLAEAVNNGADMARARSFGQRHPVFCLWPVSIRAELRDQLVNHDVRKIDRFTAAWSVDEIDFDGIPDPFFNVNTPEDRAEAERFLNGSG